MGLVGMLYVSRYNMFAWLIVAALMFCKPLQKRDHFVKRFILSTLVSFVLLTVISFVENEINVYLALNSSNLWDYVLINLICHLLVYGIYMLFIGSCYKAKFITIFFIWIAGYSTQAIALSINDAIAAAFPLLKFLSWQPITVYAAIFYLICYAISYFAIYYFYAKTMGKVKILSDVYSTSTLLTFIICLLLIVVIKSVANPFESSSKVLFIMINLGIFIVGINVLGVQFHMTKTMSLRRETEMVLHIKDLRLAQYENIKQSMAIINEKTHDLKHQLIALKKNYSIDESYMNDIEQAMQIYDTMINTGNKALDVVISDKKLICSKKGIEISVIADGSKLSFMSDANIYSLFGNALDNAIEYLDKVDEKNRTIKVNVQGQGKMVSISVRNYYEGEPVKSEKGLKTSKDNEQWHGFGIKSIKKIAESYGGSLVVYSEENAFILSILITA